MRKVRKLVAILGLALAFAPLAWERMLLPRADAQFQAWQQAATLQNAVSATGNGATFDTSGNPIVAFQVSAPLQSTFTVVPEGSLDGTTWTTLTCYFAGVTTAETVFSNSNLPSLARCNVVGIPLVRARIATWSVGAVTVKAIGTQSYFQLGTLVP